MIKLDNVNFKYKTEKEVLKNINLEINEGEFVSIIGKNGSGKSTFAKVISGLEIPTKGQVYIDEINTNISSLFGSRQIDLFKNGLMKASFQRPFLINLLGSE